MLALNINNVRITPASATDAVLPGSIRVGPVVIFFLSRLWIFRGRF